MQEYDAVCLCRAKAAVLRTSEEGSGQAPVLRSAAPMRAGTECSMLQMLRTGCKFMLSLKHVDVVIRFLTVALTI
ncbi:hypothetical protein NQ318_021708 [Aromia moschata]|uniref:Uncharacterized protein n=1 Tax=Aromia moschata TaxID=1265417 RepID=A0AAV8XA20_9CUCU|nr:hypothetical protein NQ318_021708 [Aromia moschata]